MCGELKALAQRFMHEMAKPGEFSRYVHAHIKVPLCVLSQGRGVANLQMRTLKADVGKGSP
jgi:hypothetical protein